MQLTVLGCRSGMPADGQPSSGYLVEAGPTTLLLDCGPGIVTALSAVAAPAALDAVVISHLHLDHCYDLLPLGKALLHARARQVLAELPDADPFTALQSLDQSAPGVPLYVPEGGRSVLDRLAALFPVATFPLLDRAFDIAFDVREYRPGDVVEVGACRLSMHLLRHTAPNCGVRIETPNGSLAYTGDTGLAAGLGPLCHGVDLLLAEATLDHTDTGPHGHLSGADAGTVAATHGVGELVLTHFTTADAAVLAARRAAAAAVFVGPVRLAAPGRRFPVSPALPPAPRLPAAVPGQ
ncbi:MBL fold metallo-hydrolase [Pseudonocardia xinjiangensis]|uniref:MBL fold metallo-hydrolase n=1 Tax=Pseudonocardia xinjiangensis TaxID=75289 RepID=UPI003D8A0696